MLLGNRLRADRGRRRMPVATGEEQDKRKRDTEIAGIHRNRISSEALGITPEFSGASRHNPLWDPKYLFQPYKEKPQLPIPFRP